MTVGAQQESSDSVVEDGEGEEERVAIPPLHQTSISVPNDGWVKQHL